jgi:hypothetical protein
MNLRDKGDIFTRCYYIVIYDITIVVIIIVIITTIDSVHFRTQ